ncbi:hypothetical protein [Rhizobium phage RHph_X2_28B]|uniref:hypothetical protein n=1 Tax=Rhizobium phage RHph_X2_28B TaxID=2836086 RepID=UPI0023293BF6|nr:hypothetical protein PP751_gp041 [Rhizobium phage RHph_X2_28B]QWY83493.1 hypothetical protein [Rhizobium phage RHph_X2_28B]QWY83729.1 hypothetical protein [Rhizobium phage RHph_X3_15]
MFTLRQMPEDFKSRHDEVATLTMSGTEIIVGNMVAKDDEALFIYLDEMPDPVYMSISEAKMLIAVLNVAINEQEKLGPRVE